MHHATSRASQEEFEPRRGKRFDADWPIIIKGKNSEGLEIEDEGSLINISCSGALAYVRAALPIGTALEVRIRIPLRRDAWMGYKGEIVRIVYAPAGRGIGIRFDPARPVFIQK